MGIGVYCNARHQGYNFYDVCVEEDITQLGLALSRRNKHRVLSALPDVCEKLQAARAGFEPATPAF